MESNVNYYEVHIIGNSNISIFFYIFNENIEIDIYDNNNLSHIIKHLLNTNINYIFKSFEIEYIIKNIKELILEFISHDEENIDEYIYYFKIISNHIKNYSLYNNK